MLIVAHPDDEILWFGSIGAAVDSIVICFMHDPGSPDLAGARKRTLADHPWKDRIECLGLDETRAFGHAEWPLPELTDAGLKISRNQEIEQVYRQCAKELRQLLEARIGKAGNIFTHNPWGEYGHEEHVMVHRVATSLAQARGAAIWYNNYASNWSKDLMLHYLHGFGRPYYRAEIDGQAMQQIAHIYRAHDAWTWLDDFAWFHEECFVKGPLAHVNESGFGSLFPTNLLRLPDRTAAQKTESRSLPRRLIRRLMLIWSRIFGAAMSGR